MVLFIVSILALHAVLLNRKISFRLLKITIISKLTCTIHTLIAGTLKCHFEYVPQSKQAKNNTPLLEKKTKRKKKAEKRHWLRLCSG